MQRQAFLIAVSINVLLGLYGASTAWAQSAPGFELLKKEPRVVGNVQLELEESDNASTASKRKSKQTGYWALATAQAKEFVHYGASKQGSLFFSENIQERVKIIESRDNFLLSITIPLWGDDVKFSFVGLGRKFLWEGESLTKATGAQFGFRIEQRSDLTSENIAGAVQFPGVSIGYMEGRETTTFDIQSSNSSVHENYEYDILLFFLSLELAQERSYAWFSKFDFTELRRDSADGAQFNTPPSQRLLWSFEFGKQLERRDQVIRMWSLSFGQYIDEFLIESIYADEHNGYFSEFAVRVTDKLDLTLRLGKDNSHRRFSDLIDVFENNSESRRLGLGFVWHYGAKSRRGGRRRGVPAFAR